MNLPNLLERTASIARDAGAILRDGFGGVKASTNKDGRHNLVTEYDTRVERFLADALRDLAPDSSFLGEEGGLRSGSGAVEWIVDPLDGTVNFAHGIPIFCVSIGARIHGELALGVIHHPLLDETFTAARGSGSHLNGQPISVSTTARLQDSILVTGFPYDVDSNPRNCIGQFAAVVGQGLPIRRLGSAALDLAYTAAGRFDGFWEVKLNEWDMAAGVVILNEAGGRVSHYGNDPFQLTASSIVATNGRIHDELVELLDSVEHGR